MSIRAKTHRMAFGPKTMCLLAKVTCPRAAWAILVLSHVRLKFVPFQFFPVIPRLPLPSFLKNTPIECVFKVQANPHSNARMRPGQSWHTMAVELAAKNCNGEFQHHVTLQQNVARSSLESRCRFHNTTTNTNCFVQKTLNSLLRFVNI